MNHCPQLRFDILYRSVKDVDYDMILPFILLFWFHLLNFFGMSKQVIFSTDDHKTSECSCLQHDRMTPEKCAWSWTWKVFFVEKTFRGCKLGYYTWQEKFWCHAFCMKSSWCNLSSWDLKTVSYVKYNVHGLTYQPKKGRKGLWVLQGGREERFVRGHQNPWWLTREDMWILTWSVVLASITDDNSQWNFESV